MKFGINGTGLVQRASIDAIVDDATQAARDGFTSYWLAEHPTGGLDALTVLTVVGSRVPNIELGTAIVPTMPRHPLVLAGQALTTNAAIGGRLTLGIGLSHEPMMAQLGLGFDKPIRHLREYLSVLMPLLDEGRVSFAGETIRCEAQLFKRTEPRCSVIVAALGPQALAVAGARTDGTALAWVGPRTIREHIVPTIGAAAAKAGRPAPRIVATLPICVTNEAEKVRATIDRNLAMYGKLPSYRAMFDREGVNGPGDIALIGDEDTVASMIDDLRAAGVTDFAPSEFARSPEERTRTRTLLKTQQR
ncbi:MAG TPA: TIGR03564 family F420-dependent LLM class oxidoreductase [Pseudomonadales bacterium]|nr:TIGR03564 family F420-dependent LLM class oxidoreductase [Pseudomonadales bacterium]